MSSQAELVALFDQTRATLDDFVVSRSPQEIAAPGGAQDWSAKELISLSGFWMNYMTERIAVHAQGQTPPARVDFDALNQRALAESAAQPWDVVVASTHAALARLTDAVRDAPDALLVTDNIYGSGPGDPLWGEIQANGFIWPLQEMEKYARRKGENERAALIHARLVAVVDEPEMITCTVISPSALAALPAPPVIIDVRDAEDFAAGHLPGARHIPLRDLPQHLSELAQDHIMVTYCNMHHPGQSRGERAAALLAEQGYDARALAGGYPAWVAQEHDAP